MSPSPKSLFALRSLARKGMKEEMKVVIAAAGTAGHINPGLAIAKKIQEEQKDSKIIFIGTTRGLENDLVPRAGYELKTIDAYGLSKKISIDSRRGAGYHGLRRQWLPD